MIFIYIYLYTYASGRVCHLRVALQFFHNMYMYIYVFLHIHIKHVLKDELTDFLQNLW